jgi:hypothetical protein
MSNIQQFLEMIKSYPVHVQLKKLNEKFIEYKSLSDTERAKAGSSDAYNSYMAEKIRLFRLVLKYDYSYSCPSCNESLLNCEVDVVAGTCIHCKSVVNKL